MTQIITIPPIKLPTILHAAIILNRSSRLKTASGYVCRPTKNGAKLNKSDIYKISLSPSKKAMTNPDRIVSIKAARDSIAVIDIDVNALILSLAGN